MDSGSGGRGGGGGNVCEIAAARCHDIAGRVLFDQGYIKEATEMAGACIGAGRACNAVFASPGLGGTIGFPPVPGGDTVTIWPWNGRSAKL